MTLYFYSIFKKKNSTGAVFALDILAPYDYYMRLDSDSFLIGPVTFDVFERMRDGDFRYAFLQVFIYVHTHTHTHTQHTN